MRKVLLAVSLALLVSSQVLAAPRNAPHRPSPRGFSPIARVWAQITSLFAGHRLAGDEHTLPPPPSTVIAGG